MNTGEIEWPEPEAFQPLVKASKHSPKAPPAPVMVSVSEKGIVTVTLAPEVQQAFLSRVLGVNEKQPVYVSSVVTDESVALRIAGAGGGNYTVRGAVKESVKGKPQRAWLNLGKCGGVEFVSRKATAAAHKFGGGDLFVAIPIYVEAEEDTGEGDDDADAGAKASPPPAGKFDFASAATLAVDAALKAWPTKIDRLANPIRIAACVAMIEAGFNEADARKRLDCEGFILAAREDMRNPGAAAATAALEALREAMED